MTKYLTLITLGLLACNNPKKPDMITSMEIHGSFTHTIIGDDTPPPFVNSRFKTFDEWLKHIAATKPEKDANDYNFSLIESKVKPKYILCFEGSNTWEESPTETITEINPIPLDFYFNLPEEFQNLSREQLTKKLSDELMSFSKSKFFSKSYLANTKKIGTDWGHIIWSR